MRPPRTAVPLIITINVLIYLLWLLISRSNLDFMTDHFLVSWTGLMLGRGWTLITSVFSHMMFFHLFLNMYVFLGFGSFLEMALGSRRFLRFYLGAGVFASLCHCLVSAYLMDQPELQALGASGAVAGVVVLFSLMFPRERILLFGLVPIPAIWGVVLFVGLDLWGLIAQTQGHQLPIGYGAHLGGALAGFVYYRIIGGRKRLGTQYFRRI